MEEQLPAGWARGPVDSRRFGRSLDVNLLPTDRKLCSMSCVYCGCGAAPGDAELHAKGELPSRREVLAAVESRLACAPVDTVTISGNGEPTLHPEFPGVVADLLVLRARLCPEASVVVLTNGTQLHRRPVRSALEHLDAAYVKLDAGDDATLKAVNRPKALHFYDLLANLVSLVDLRLQSMFVQGSVDNTGPRALGRWLEALSLVRPTLVHVTTIDRGTCEPGLRPVPAAFLSEIASMARREGIAAEAYPAREEVGFT